MPEKSKPRRKIPTLLAIFAVTVSLLFLTVMWVNSFFRRKMVKLDELRFPILVISSAGAAPYATWDASTLCNISRTSVRIPTDGMILIDSDFRMVTLENVTCNNGELSSIARALLPAIGFRYKFDLRQRDDSGLAAAVTYLTQCAGFTDNPADDPAIRQQLSHQTTMEGMLAALRLEKPPAPTLDTQPATTEPDSVTTEPLP